jgi:FG-GAP repeat
MRKALLAPVAVSLSFLWFSTSSGQTRTQRFVSSRPVARKTMSAKSSGSGPGPWVQMAKLTGSGQAFFGPVSISDDTVVVGHPTGSVQKNAYVFVKPPGGWKNMTQVAILTPSDQAPGFAISVSISGDTIAIGAPGAKPEGAVYVYVKPASGWHDMTETAKLTSSDGQSELGDSVSLSGNTIVAGAPGAFYSGAGAAFVFVKPGRGWKDMTQTAKLESSDNAGGDMFGWSVGISGDTVVAGAPQVSTGNGKGYVFVKPTTGWHNMTETAELTPSNGGFELNFGWAAAIDGNTAVFSQSGDYVSDALYVFVRPQSGWRDINQTAELTATGSDSTYGDQVAIQGNEIVTGDVWYGPVGFEHEGAAFLYVRPTNGWMDSSHPNATLTGSDARLGSLFGAGVALSGKSVVLTANTVGNGNIHSAGAGYLFLHP